MNYRQDFSAGALQNPRRDRQLSNIFYRLWFFEGVPILAPALRTVGSAQRSSQDEIDAQIHSSDHLRGLSREEVGNGFGDPCS